MNFRKFKKWIFSILLVTIVLSSISPAMTMVGNSFSVRNDLRTSDVIAISSPVDQFYTPHMEGYYPATFGFEDEEDETSGLAINFIDSVSTYGTCKVKAEYFGHKKVLYVKDALTYTGMHFQHWLDSAQTDGFIEFWFAMDDFYQGYNDYLLFYSMDASNNRGFEISMHGDVFRDAQSNEVDMDYNTWYHVRIVFDCSEGINGLYDWYINGVEIKKGVEMVSSVNDITKLSIRGYSSAVSVGYFDSFGFSWDSDYELGMNFPIEGYYPATYGFENDEDGTDPEGWTTSETYGDIKVVSDIDDHNKVLEFHDTSSGANVQAYNYFSEGVTSGTIDFWLQNSDATDEALFQIKYGSTLVIYFGIYDDAFRYKIGSWFEILSPALDNTWYHIRVDFECNGDGYDGLAQYHWNIDINGIEYGDYAFISNVAEIDNICITSRKLDSNYYFYVDAIGYSWDPNYESGDNRLEGLLIDIEPKGLGPLNYQLDSNPNVTFSDATVIPFPQDGSHTITVSGGGHTPDTVSFETSGIFIPKGGLNRNFPIVSTQEPVTKLGYSFYTAYVVQPILQFAIIGSGSETGVNINLYIDQAQYWTTTINLASPDYAYTSGKISVPVLTEYLPHTIILEIESSGNFQFTLDYLKIYNAECEDLVVEGDNVYSAPGLNLFQDEDGIDTVATRNLLKKVYENGVAYFQEQDFLNTLTATVDEDRDYEDSGGFPPFTYHETFTYFIERFKVTWRILKPNGEYCDADNLDEADPFKTSVSAYEAPETYNEEVDLFIDLASGLMGSSGVGYIILPVLKYLISELTKVGQVYRNPVFTSGCSDDKTWVEYVDGRKYVGIFQVGPMYFLKQISFCNFLEPILPSLCDDGNILIETSYEVDVYYWYQYSSGLAYDSECIYSHTLAGVHYTNYYFDNPYR